MRQLCYVMILATCYACTPGQADTQAADSIVAATDSIATLASTSIDSTAIEDLEPDEDAPDADPEDTGTLSADGEYTITNQGLYVSDPFEFSLDTTAIHELLPSATFSFTEYPGGKDEYGGEYSGFTYFEVFAGKTTLSFYSYSGKHHADIDTPDLVMRNNIYVGMTREEFIERMSLGGYGPREAKTFTINDDYGSVSFYFNMDTDALARIYVYYEEGD